MINSDFDRSLNSRKRSLSRFFAKELILDYVEGRLDEGRLQAMKEYLIKDKELNRDVEALKTALQYVDRLVEIEVSPEVVKEIETARVGWSRWVEILAWRNWPDVARWSIEAFVVAAVLAAMASLLPMNKLAKLLPRPAQELILAEVKPEVPSQLLDATPAALDDEKLALAAAPEPVPPPVPKEKVPLRADPVPQAAAVEKKEVKSETESSETSNEEVGSPVTATGKGPKGFVYRAFMSAGTIDETTTSVKTLVEALGGTKAGQVDLGWRKTAGTYFHFALPESNYDKLIEGLRSFGPVRIYKDPHWRLMPEGQIRLILYIEDATLKK